MAELFWILGLFFKFGLYGIAAFGGLGLAIVFLLRLDGLPLRGNTRKGLAVASLLVSSFCFGWLYANDRSSERIRQLEKEVKETTRIFNEESARAAKRVEEKERVDEIVDQLKEDLATGKVIGCPTDEQFNSRLRNILGDLTEPGR